MAMRSWTTDSSHDGIHRPERCVGSRRPGRSRVAASWAKMPRINQNAFDRARRMPEAPPVLMRSARARRYLDPDYVSEDTPRILLGARGAHLVGVPR